VEYDPKNLDDWFVHLTNNSVAKYAKNGSEIGIGNMWTSEMYSEYLKQTYGKDMWEEGGLRKNIQQLVINTLLGVQDMFDESKPKGKHCELYGFDIFIDEEVKPWLIEVNSSPTMEYSTGITEKLCHQVMEDTIKVIVDYSFASTKKKPSINTGDWELIFTSNSVVEKQLSSFGENFVCEGKKMKIWKPKKGYEEKEYPDGMKIPEIEEEED